MSERSDLERDIAEEDELRRLLRSGDRDLQAPGFGALQRRARRTPRPLGPFEALAVAAALVLAIGLVASASRPPAPAASPSGSAIPTSSPEVASPQAAVPLGPGAEGVCPAPPRPGYLPWPSSASELITRSAITEHAFLGPGSGPERPRVIVALSLFERPRLIPIAGEDRPQEVDGREVLVQPGAARASWRVEGPCPLITVALLGPERDAAAQQAELLRIVASMPAVSSAPAATARAADDYGLLVQGRDGKIQLVRESDSKMVAALDENLPYALAVSRNGREIAYAKASGRELWLADAADLAHARRLIAVSGERVTGVVWSPDGTSLMFAAASTTFEPVTEGAPVYTALRVVGRDGSGPRELARIANGQFVRPLAWDAARGLGAAEEGLGQKGPGRYVLVSADRPLEIGNGKSSKIRYMDLPDAGRASVHVSALQASDDARFVMASWAYGDRSIVRFWPLEGLDLGRMRELTAERAGATVRDPAWRPGSHEIGVNAGGRLELWTLDGQRRPVAQLGGSAGVRFVFRYDGTAVYRPAGSNGRTAVIDLSTAGGTPRDISPSVDWIRGSVDLH